MFEYLMAFLFGSSIIWVPIAIDMVTDPKGWMSND